MLAVPPQDAGSRATDDLSRSITDPPVGQPAPQAQQVDHHGQPDGKLSAVLACRNLEFTTHIQR